MPTPTFRAVLNVQDPSKNGLHVSRQSLARVPPWVVVWGDRADYVAIEFAEPSPAGSGNPLQPITALPSSARLAIGFGHRKPTSGSFRIRLTFDGDTADTADIAFDASAATVASAVSSVASTLTTGLVTFTGALSGTDVLLTANITGETGITMAAISNTLQPESAVTTRLIVDGTDMEQTEVWRIRWQIKGLAYAELSTPLTGLTSPITATSLQTGTASLPSLQRITLPVVPVGGIGILSWGRKEVNRITAVADVAGSLHNQVAFTLYDNNNAPVDFVLYIYGEVDPLPAPPAGGSQEVIEYVEGDSATTLAGLMVTAVDGHADFTAVLDDIGTSVVVTNSAYGTRTAVDGGTLTATRIATGVARSGIIGHNASAADWETALGGSEVAQVSISAPGVYDISFVANGAADAITLNTTNFITPKGLQGPIEMDELAMQKAFEGGVESLSPQLSIEFDIDSKPFTALMTPCIVKRDVVTTV